MDRWINGSRPISWAVSIAIPLIPLMSFQNGTYSFSLPLTNRKKERSAVIYDVFVFLV